MTSPFLPFPRENAVLSAPQGDPRSSPKIIPYRLPRRRFPNFGLLQSQASNVSSDACFDLRQCEDHPRNPRGIKRVSGAKFPRSAAR